MVLSIHDRAYDPTYYGWTWDEGKDMMFMVNGQ